MGLLGIRGKENNSRRYPGEFGARPDLADSRRECAKERQSIHETLSPQEKLMKLDAKFGAGKGAAKERAKLQQLIQSGGQIKVSADVAIEALGDVTLPPEVMAEIEAMNNEDGGVNKKKLKAKDRRARGKNTN